VRAEGLVVALAAVLAWPAAALAHGMLVDCTVLEDGTVRVEAYYIDGTPVSNGVVRVRDSAGRVLLQGTTNAQGVFDFRPVRAEDLQVEVIQAGHKAKGRVKAEALRAAAQRAGAVAATSAPASQAAPALGRDASASAAAAPLRRHTFDRRYNLLAATAGIALIVALGSFWYAWRLGRRLQELAQRLDGRPQD